MVVDEVVEVEVVVGTVVGGTLVEELVAVLVEGSAEVSDVSEDAHAESASIATTAPTWTNRTITSPTHHCHSTRRFGQSTSHAYRYPCIAWCRHVWTGSIDGRMMSVALEVQCAVVTNSTDRAHRWRAPRGHRRASHVG